jgi:hypothetical protein
MDGISTSSFGGLPPFPLSPPARVTPQLRRESVILAHTQQLSAKISISHDGDALARKAQSQGDRLAQLDPQLVEQYHAVIELLNHTNPEAVEHFLAFMDTILANANAPGDASAPGDTVLPKELRGDLEASVRVSELVARVQAGRVTVSQESLELNIQLQRGSQAQKKVDPLVLDLDGDGVETSGVEAGVFFDIEANGEIALVSFVQGEDILLALDRNGNGVIDDGGELFGVQHSAKNGFEELKKCDDNHDGVINAQDAVFSQLGGLRRNAAGLEFVSLSRLGVREISTVYRERREALPTGDDILQDGAFRHSNGALGRAFDVGLSRRV